MVIMHDDMKRNEKNTKIRNYKFEIDYITNLIRHFEMN